MASTDTQAGATTAVRTRSERFDAIERSLRLWSGVVLFVFVAMHLINHAIGVAGLEAMSAVADYRVWIWRTWVGSALLYGAAAVHIFFVTKRLITRRTWRMPIQEALQIALGFTIPLLLYKHVIGTRYVSEFHGVDDSYAATLQLLWQTEVPMQIALVLVAWIHGVIGIHYTIRAKAWFPRVREYLLILSVLVPLAALAGFIASAREAVRLGHAGASWTPEQFEAAIAALRTANWALLIFAGLLALGIIVLAIKRRFGRRVQIRYHGHGLIELPRGSTVLEGSREVGIPHPSLCGGRARCSTCRVLVTEGGDSLPPPGASEAAMLKRISAPTKVRLACQIRPERPISLQILLPVDAGEGNVDWSDEAMKWGTAREATVLFVDLRAFSRLSETQLPYDLVALLNRYISEMRQAVTAHSGRTAMLLSDGLMAVFGLNGERGYGSRNALAAARDMQRSVDAMNEELHAALAMPLRIGIGVHTGPVVMARIGDEAHGFSMTALGETVTIASRLETATKTELTDSLVSEDTLKAASRHTPVSSRRRIHIPGLAEPIVAYALSDSDAADSSEEREDAGTGELQDVGADTRPDPAPAT